MPSMNLTSALARPKGQEENRLEGQMLRGLLDWFKWSLSQLVQDQWEVPGGDAPPAFGSVSMETIQEMSEIFVLADVEGWISQFISNGWPVTYAHAAEWRHKNLKAQEVTEGRP